MGVGGWVGVADGPGVSVGGAGVAVAGIGVTVGAGGAATGLPHAESSSGKATTMATVRGKTIRLDRDTGKPPPKIKVV